jgi:hypothetical protein
MRLALVVALMLFGVACSDSGDDTAKVVASSNHEDTARGGDRPDRPSFPIPDTTPEPSPEPEPSPTPSEPSYTEVTLYDVAFTLTGKRVVTTCEKIMDGDEPSNCGLNLSKCKDGMTYYCVTNAQVSEHTEKVLDTDDSNQ